MREHALSDRQREVCGLLGGNNDTMTHYYPVLNIAADRCRTFLMDPVGQLRALKLMRERDESMRGIFHTHPTSPAHPSPRDSDEARYPGVYYLIISMMRREPELSVYYYDDGKFMQVTDIVEVIR